MNYTSGSTGVPKGVEVVNRGIVRLVKNTNWVEVFQNDKILQISNISFDAVTYEIWGSLLNGASLCIYPYEKLIPDELGNFIFNKKITQVLLTAKLFNLMIDEQIDNLKILKYLFSGGEIMSVFHAKRAFKVLDNCRIINAYGPTENTVVTSSYVLTNVKDIEDGVPVGKPISNTSIYILDKNLEPVPIGVVGELYTGGDGLAKGYLNQKKLTNEKFIKNPFSKMPRAKMYKTGDLAKFLSDGNIMFTGRSDFQVKIRGFRIELQEIEQIVKKIENINNCVCILCEETK